MIPVDTHVKPGSGRTAAARRRRRKKLTFDKVSFMVVFLGVPLAMYLIFVISPFVQAFYYSLTDWSGFTPKMNFIGISNYRRLFSDAIFMKAVRNNILLVIVLPIVTIILSPDPGHPGHGGRQQPGPDQGAAQLEFYRVISFFPYTIPAIAIGIMWGQIYDPSSGLVNGILTAWAWTSSSPTHGSATNAPR